MSKNVRFKTEVKTRDSGQYKKWALVVVFLVAVIVFSGYIILKNNDFDFRSALGGDPDAVEYEDESMTEKAEKTDKCFLFWCKDSVTKDLQFFWITKISEPKGKYTILSPSLDESIDLTIQQCPIDYRRRLYADIVFSGGSTSFKNLDKRLEYSLQKRVDERLKKYTAPGKQSSIKVKVTNSMAQKHVVWLGGSSFSSNDGFKSTVHTRAEYQEKGPSCCRFNPVFSF